MILRWLLPALARRAAEGSDSGTGADGADGSAPLDLAADLATQWANPADISTILLIIGGDVVQRAYAQAAGGGTPFVPVCFSFGCVAYAFIGLVGVLGDGRLLPPPDYEAKVINLETGYSRDNRNFVVGRLLRDLEAREAREAVADGHDDYALQISVFEACWNPRRPTEFSWRTRLHLVGLLVTLVQLGIAAIPWATRGTWNVFLITAVGTLLVQWTGALPQWAAEKLPVRQKSTAIYALTSGNGSREVIVILGYGNCLDLESLAASQTPRNGRPWEKFSWLSRPRKLTPSTKTAAADGAATTTTTVPDTDSAVLHRHKSWRREAKICPTWPFRSFPIGFVITHVSYVALSILWLLLLVNVSAPKHYPEAWCLLAVGGLGMFQNGWLAAKELPPESRNLPLRRVDRVRAHKVMDGLMDFDVTYGLGRPLLDEYFPGGELRAAERRWWDGDYEEYDADRRLSARRGPSRRERPDLYPKLVYSVAGLGSSSDLDRDVRPVQDKMSSSSGRTTATATAPEATSPTSTTAAGRPSTQARTTATRDEDLRRTTIERSRALTSERVSFADRGGTQPEGIDLGEVRPTPRPSRSGTWQAPGRSLTLESRTDSFKIPAWAT